MTHTSKRILTAIGADAMQMLIDEFAGEKLHIPNTMPHDARDCMILHTFSESLKSGASCMSSYEDCAEESGLSVRQVQRIVAGA